MTGSTCGQSWVRLPGGQRVSYAVFGAAGGLPVVALHGAPSSRLMYRAADQAAHAAGLCLYAPDRPGYGGTSDGLPATLEARTDWLEALVDTLGLEHFTLLAVSGGAPYAVALAERLPGRVDGLALVSPMGPVADYVATAVGTREPIPFLQRRFFLHLPRRRWLVEPAAEAAGLIYRNLPWIVAGMVPRVLSPADAPILMRPEVRRAMQEMTSEGFRQGGRGGIADLEIFSSRWHVAYERITAPAVLWQGTADRIVPPAASLHLASQLPRCQLIRIEGAGHFWIFDHIPEVVAAVRALADGAGRARSSAF